MKHKYVSQIEDIDDKKGLVTVYANAFNNVDSDNDISLPGSFTKTINESFHRLKWFLNHDSTKLLGVPVEAIEDQFGLKVTGQLNMKKTIAKDILEDYILYHNNGKTLEHSIGVTAMKWEYDQATDIRRVSEWKWWEYSTLTSWGANEATPLVDIKSLQDIDNTILWLEKMLKGNYSDERLQQVESTIITLKSLKAEPFGTVKPPDTQDEPIDITEILNKSKLFKL